MTKTAASSPTDIALLVESLGYAICPEFLNTEQLCELEKMVADIHSGPGLRSRGSVYAIRNLLNLVPGIRNFATTDHIMDFVRTMIGESARPVRGLLFDKNADANWVVPWHQDLTICVKEKQDVPGFGPWSVKAGLPHVQPPVWVLESMVAVRFHLDAATRENGALRVLPGSHKFGRLRSDQIKDYQHGVTEVLCTLPREGVLFMKPLLLHASSPALQPTRRRVVHIEYAPCDLPSKLGWYEDTLTPERHSSDRPKQ